MNTLRKYLIGFGFFWIFAWSVLGSIVGAKLNIILTTQAGLPWLDSLQRSFLRTAHAHMNAMSMSLILVGLSMPLIRNTIKSKYIAWTACFFLFSIPLFGFGLLIEAFYPTTQSHMSFGVALSALGGGIYMLSVLTWACFFFVPDKKI